MKKFLITLTTALALAMSGALIGNATEDGYTETFLGSNYHDGTKTDYYRRTSDDGTVDYLWENYVLTVDGWELDSYGKVNPNPESDGKGVSDPREAMDHLINRVKQKGGELRITPDFAKTLIGKYLINQGQGLATKYQPGDDEVPGGAPPPKDKPDLKPDIEAMTTPPGGHPTDIPFEPNSGGVKEHVKKAAKKGGLNKKDSNNDGPGDKAATDAGLLFGGLPGPPELVNPNPVARMKAKGNQPGAAMSLPSAAAAGPSTRTTAPRHGGAVGKLR